MLYDDAMDDRRSAAQAEDDDAVERHIDEIMRAEQSRMDAYFGLDAERRARELVEIERTMHFCAAFHAEQIEQPLMVRAEDVWGNLA